MMAQDRMTCPKCKDGYAGRDSTGEAMDCHYCDGKGYFTAQEVCNLHDRLASVVGDEMYAAEIIARVQRLLSLVDYSDPADLADYELVMGYGGKTE